MPSNELTQQEARFVVDVLGMWAEGLVSAKDHTIADRAIHSPEQLLELTDGLLEQQEMVSTIQRKLERISGN